MAHFLIADNQDITRLGLHQLISDIADKTEPLGVTDTHTRSELIAQLKEHEDAIVVLDYTQFDLYSVDELLNISHRFTTARWILFSNELSEGFIRRLSFEPNMSMILKDANLQELTSTLRYNINGERYLSQNIMSFLLTESHQQKEIREKLTASEIEILKLVAQGKSVKEIAAERMSSTHTITTHKKNIFRKLNVNTVYEATKYALSSGLVDMAEYYI